MLIREFTAWSNVTKQRTPEFACRREHEATRLAAKYLGCPIDDVAIVWDEVDPWIEQDRVTAAIQGLKKKRAA